MIFKYISINNNFIINCSMSKRLSDNNIIQDSEHDKFIEFKEDLGNLEENLIRLQALLPHWINSLKNLSKLYPKLSKQINKFIENLSKIKKLLSLRLNKISDILSLTQLQDINEIGKQYKELKKGIKDFIEKNNYEKENINNILNEILVSLQQLFTIKKISKKHTDNFYKNIEIFKKSLPIFKSPITMLLFFILLMIDTKSMKGQGWYTKYNIAKTHSITKDQKIELEKHIEPFYNKVLNEYNEEYIESEYSKMIEKEKQIKEKQIEKNIENYNNFILSENFIIPPEYDMIKKIYPDLDFQSNQQNHNENKTCYSAEDQIKSNNLHKELKEIFKKIQETYKKHLSSKHLSLATYLSCPLSKKDNINLKYIKEQIEIDIKQYNNSQKDVQIDLQFNFNDIYSEYYEYDEYDILREKIPSMHNDLLKIENEYRAKLLEIAQMQSNIFHTKYKINDRFNLLVHYFSKTAKLYGKTNYLLEKLCFAQLFKYKKTEEFSRAQKNKYSSFAKINYIDSVDDNNNVEESILPLNEALKELHFAKSPWTYLKLFVINQDEDIFYSTIATTLENTYKEENKLKCIQKGEQFYKNYLDDELINKFNKQRYTNSYENKRFTDAFISDFLLKDQLIEFYENLLIKYQNKYENYSIKYYANLISFLECYQPKHNSVLQYLPERILSTTNTLDKLNDILNTTFTNQYLFSVHEKIKLLSIKLVRNKKNPQTFKIQSNNFSDNNFISFISNFINRQTYDFIDFIEGIIYNLSDLIRMIKIKNNENRNQLEMKGIQDNKSKFLTIQYDQKKGNNQSKININKVENLEFQAQKKNILDLTSPQQTILKDGQKNYLFYTLLIGYNIYENQDKLSTTIAEYLKLINHNRTQYIYVTNLISFENKKPIMYYFKKILKKINILEEQFKEYTLFKLEYKKINQNFQYTPKDLSSLADKTDNLSENLIKKIIEYSSLCRKVTTFIFQLIALFKLIEIELENIPYPQLKAIEKVHSIYKLEDTIYIIYDLLFQEILLQTNELDSLFINMYSKVRKYFNENQNMSKEDLKCINSYFSKNKSAINEQINFIINSLEQHNIKLNFLLHKNYPDNILNKNGKLLIGTKAYLDFFYRFRNKLLAINNDIKNKHIMYEEFLEFLSNEVNRAKKDVKQNIKINNNIDNQNKNIKEKEKKEKQNKRKKIFIDYQLCCQYEKLITSGEFFILEQKSFPTIKMLEFKEEDVKNNKKIQIIEPKINELHYKKPPSDYFLENNLERIFEKKNIKEITEKKQIIQKNIINEQNNLEQKIDEQKNIFDLAIFNPKQYFSSDVKKRKINILNKKIFKYTYVFFLERMLINVEEIKCLLQLLNKNTNNKDTFLILNKIAILGKKFKNFFKKMKKNDELFIDEKDLFNDLIKKSLIFFYYLYIISISNNNFTKLDNFLKKEKIIKYDIANFKKFSFFDLYKKNRVSDKQIFEISEDNQYIFFNMSYFYKYILANYKIKKYARIYEFNAYVIIEYMQCLYDHFSNNIKSQFLCTHIIDVFNKSDINNQNLDENIIFNNIRNNDNFQQEFQVSINNVINTLKELINTINSPLNQTRDFKINLGNIARIQVSKNMINRSISLQEVCKNEKDIPDENNAIINHLEFYLTKSSIYLFDLYFQIINHNIEFNEIKKQIYLVEKDLYKTTKFFTKIFKNTYFEEQKFNFLLKQINLELNVLKDNLNHKLLKFQEFYNNLNKSDKNILKFAKHIFDQIISIKTIGRYLSKIQEQYQNETLKINIKYFEQIELIKNTISLSDNYIWSVSNEFILDILKLLVFNSKFEIIQNIKFNPFDIILNCKINYNNNQKEKSNYQEVLEKITKLITILKKDLENIKLVPNNNLAIPKQPFFFNIDQERLNNEIENFNNLYKTKLQSTENLIISVYK